MAVDVIRKINDSNNIKNGSAVIAADKKGNVQSLAPPRPSTVDNTTAVYNKYKNRFDNETYYV